MSEAFVPLPTQPPQETPQQPDVAMEAFHHSELNELYVDKTVDQARLEETRELLDQDALTGALNRRGLQNRLESRIENGEQVGLLFVDIDNFKNINDDQQLGHDEGDKFLKILTESLKGSLRRRGDQLVRLSKDPDDAENSPGVEEVGRFGGDEFVIIADLTPRREEGENMTPQERIDMIKSYLEKETAQLINDPKKVKPRIKDLKVGLSIGTAVLDKEQGVSTADELLKAGDEAMFIEKHRRKLESMNLMQRGVARLGRFAIRKATGASR